MKQTPKALLGIYTVFVLLDLLFIYLGENEMRWISKPLLMPFLMLFFVTSVKMKSGTQFYLILAALFLSWCGDLLLQTNLFIPGLVSFLLAHVCYILYFKQVGNKRKGLLKMQPLLAIPVLLYVVLLLAFLFPHLHELKIPVMLYSITIGVMLLTAINTRHQVNHTASFLFLSGALLFVLSDSMLAVNLFVKQHWVMSLSVMGTYAAAQYLIVKGALVNHPTLTEFR